MSTPIEKIFEDVQLHVNFTQASSRSNIVTYDSTASEPENISTAFGKLSKWYEALVPTGGSSGQILGWNSAGTAKWINHTHPTITLSADTTSTPSQLAHSGTFTAITSVTRDSNGHVTKLNTATYTLPDATATKLGTTNKGSATKGIYLNAGSPAEMTYSLSSTVNGGTANKLAYYSGANAISPTPQVGYYEINSAASTPVSRKILDIRGAGVGNTAAELISGTAGLLSYGDGGPQINFGTSSSMSTSGAQEGALIFTDHDSAATGVSWHFVSNQGDWNVTSKRFHAKTSISIGTNLPNTSYNLYVNGTTNITGNTTFGGLVTATTFTGNLSGNASSSNYNKMQGITIKTGSSDQSHITLQTLMTWLITTKAYINSNTAQSLSIYTSWSYAGNDILQLAIAGTNYELQLAGVIIEFDGYASDYQTGTFRLRIHSSPTVSFTPTSGYTQFPASHIAEYTCNGSSYSPTWKMLVDKGDTVTRTGGGASGTWGINITGNAATATTADTLNMKTLTASTLDNTAGTYGFKGAALLGGINDWAGLQIDAGDDRFQLIANGQLMFRQNDSTTMAGNWASWIGCITPNEVSAASGIKVTKTTTTLGSGDTALTYYSGIKIEHDVSTSADSTNSGSLSHGGTFTAITSVTRDTYGHVKTLNTKTYTLPASGVPSNNVTGSGTSGYLAKWSGTNTIDKTGKITYFETDNAASTPAKRAGLHIESATYGNTAATMLGGVAGIFQYGDGGPQISFKDANSTQAGALIFTADDAAATGTSWQFVSTETDWNVISNRFHAKTAISIGTTKPNASYASYALHVTGTANITGDVTFGGSVTATTFTGNLSGNANTATTASKISTTAGTANASRVVFFADNTDTGKVVYDNDFKYNPSSNILTVTSINSVALANALTSTNANAWSSIGIPLYVDGEVNHYQLKIIRTQGGNTYPTWMGWAYSSGIAFGGGDTKGVMTIRYDSPGMMFAGGINKGTNTAPTWYMGITGTSGTTYNLDNFLPLSGGTMTGVLTMKGDQYSGNYALNMNNSDIVGANRIIFADRSDSPTEGLSFWRSASTYDAFWISDGVMYFTPNSPTDTTNNVVIHSGNYTTYTVKKDGTGASGSWGISVTGSAAKLGTSDKGSATQGIYLSGGSPNAMTYSLYSTVNSGTKNYLAYYTNTNAISSTSGIYVDNANSYICAKEFQTTANASGSRSGLSNLALWFTASYSSSLWYSQAAVQTFNGKITSADGLLLAVGAGGMTIVGSGESQVSLAALIADDPTASGASKLNIGGTLNTSLVGNSEELLLSSDNSIYFLTNCQSIANRKPVCLDTNSYFYPGTNNTGSIGTSSYKWASMYATTFYGSLSGTASKAVLLDHKSLDSTTINNTAGSFAFSGAGDPWAGTDWVGLQIGDNNDKWQLTGTGSVFLWRQNDTGGTNSANWSDWKTFLDSSNYTSYTVTKTGGGASGSWGISVTGSSASCTGNAATATSATCLSNQRDVAITYGANKLEWYDLSANNGTDVTKKQNPTNDWYHHITMHHSNSNGYFVDLALCFHSNNISYRRVAAGANSSGGWIRLIDSANIADQSVASATKASQDGDGNAINTTYLKLSGGTMTGLLTLYREGTTANNYPAGITFSLKDTTTTKTYSGAYIYAYQDHQSTPYGVNLVANPGGGLFIGSGESPANHYSAKGSTYNGEDTFITADGTVFIQANGNTIANRLGFYINASHEVLPCKAETATNNVGTLGNSSYSWKGVYATNIYGTHNGKVMSSNIILRQHDNYQAGIGYDTKGNECIALWAKNTVTRLRWYAGTDMTTMTSGLMMDKTPDFEVSKADGSPRVYVGGFEIGVCYIMYDEASGTSTTVSNLNIPAGTKYFKIFIYDANTSGSNNVTNVIDIGVDDGHYGGIISGSLQAQSFPCVITAVQFIVSTSNSLKSITLGKSSSWTIGSSPSSQSHTLYIRKIIACT